MSLEGVRSQCVTLLHAPGKAGRGLIYEEPFTVILFSSQEISLRELEVNNAIQVYFCSKIYFFEFPTFRRNHPH